MFDLRRFGRLAKAHWAESWKSHAAFFGVAIVLHFIFVALALSGEKGYQAFRTDGQEGTYIIGLFLLGPVFAARQFREYARRDSALLALMRPASSFEKWLLVAAIVLLAFPVVYTLAFYVCDLPAWLIAKARVQEAWAALSVEERLNQAPYLDGNPKNYHLLNPATVFSSWAQYLSVGLTLAFAQGFGVFGAIYFRTFPLVKTFLAGFSLVMLLALISEFCDSKPDAFIGVWDSERVLSTAQMIAYPVLWCALPAMLWLAVYLALKERELA